MITNRYIIQEDKIYVLVPYTIYIKYYFSDSMRFFAPDFLQCFFGNAPFVSEQTSFVTAENSWLLSNQVEILNQAIKHHVHCFVFTSSIAVYGSINAPWPKGWFTSRRIGSICQRWKMTDFLPLRLRGFKFSLYSWGSVADAKSQSFTGH